MKRILSALLSYFKRSEDYQTFASLEHTRKSNLEEKNLMEKLFRE